ncbi:MAG: RNA pseudouridine synthase [Phycisphaerae bacterium]|nr:RNA pseudouridine synthase [Phycisphaerae bacterium]
MIDGLPVAFRNADTLVVVKPAGLSTEREAGSRGDSVLERVRGQPGWADARVPHRLDRITRGFVLVARDAKSAAFHSAQVRDRAWTKCYVARVHAPVDPQSLVGSHKRYVKRVGRIATIVRAGGDVALMDVLAVAPAPQHRDELHIAIRLVTGRYHQIRVMCADLGAPLVGDAAYGGDPARGEPSLEHALFRCAMSDGATITLFNAHDPERGAVDPSILAALAAEAGSVSATT